MLDRVVANAEPTVEPDARRPNAINTANQDANLRPGLDRPLSTIDTKLTTSAHAHGRRARDGRRLPR